MKLLRATLQDYCIFKEFFDNFDYSVLYPKYEAETNTFDSQCWNGFDFEEYTKYTIEDFNRDITCPGSYIFFVVDKKEIVGYMQIFRIQGNRYKLADWTLINNTDQTRKKVWQLFTKLKTPKMRVIDVCIFEKSQAYEWMTDLGFESTEVKSYMRCGIETSCE